jgi:hypothetical protein
MRISHEGRIVAIKTKVGVYTIGNYFLGAFKERF